MEDHPRPMVEEDHKIEENQMVIQVKADSIQYRGPRLEETIKADHLRQVEVVDLPEDNLQAKLVKAADRFEKDHPRGKKLSANHDQGNSVAQQVLKR